jgi:hypothetical protein
MATPQGVAHVEAALELVGRAGEQIERLEGVDEGWRAEAGRKLSEASELLRGTLDRFYLKTKVCLPFARRCEEGAHALEELLEEEGERAREGEAGREARLMAAIEAAAQAARVLDERSLMQGMAIT